LLLATQLQSCSKKDDDKDIHHFISAAQKQKPAPIKPLPKFLLKEPSKITNLKTTIIKNHIFPDYSVASLNMIGSLSNQKNYWALIASPDGTIKKIQVGDTLGEEQAKVITITLSDITLQEAIEKENRTMNITLSIQQNTD